VAVPPPPEKRTSFDRIGRPAEGEITQEQAAALGCTAGIVRLLTGVQGRSGGFGAAHIESNASRMKQIEGLGFKSLHAYLRYVLANVSFIGKQSDGRVVLVADFQAVYHHVICQWDADLKIWSVTTAIPKRNKRDVEVLWKSETA
jgi:hypothetical protein